MLIVVMLIISLFNLGLNYLYGSTPGFKHVAEYFKPDDKAPEWKFNLYDPFFGCPMCHSSVYGIPLAFIIQSYYALPLYLIPVSVIGSVFTTFILLLVKEKLDA